MTRGLRIAGAVATLALPGLARLALAFAAVVLLPGAALLGALGVRPPGGGTLAPGWWLGLGLAWAGALVLATRALHLPFTVLAGPAGAVAVLPWLLPPRATTPHADDVVLRRVALAAVLAAAALALVHCVRLPTPVSYYSDSPDHIGTIRRMMASGDAFPTDAFFRDAGRGGADPRKGLWHPVVAWLALLARVDPVPAWQALAALLAPLFVLNAAAFGALVAGVPGAVVGGWALLLTYGGSLGAQYLREAVFATKLADQLALATVTAVIADLGARTRASRLAAVGLALGSVAAHVFTALQFAVTFGALGVGMVVRDRGLSAPARRLAVTALALGAACVPYLAWRAHVAYAPGNVIHTEPQGLLELWPGVRVVSVGVLWDWLGPLWAVFPLSWWAWARAARNPAVLSLLTTSVAVALLLFFPPVVGVLEPRIGYLLMRFVWLLPLAGALAFAVPALARGLRQRPAAAAAGAVVLLALLAPALGDAVVVALHPGRFASGDAFDSCERWRGDLAWMDTHLPAGTVVLSDPATSYSVPMRTRHWVATLVDQHSSPNDTLALRRILDARDALDPWSAWDVTRGVVRRYGVTAIVLNDRFAEVPRLDYWAPSPEWFRAARARFDSAPAAFARVYDGGHFVVYAVNAAALDTLRGGGGARPYVRAWDPAHDPPGVPAEPGVPGVLGVRLSKPVTFPGDTVGLAIDWRAARALPAGCYGVAVRLDRPLPPGLALPEWCAKPWRKLVEKFRHERFRVRVDRLPVAGDYGVDRWRPDQVVRDSIAFWVPDDTGPGRYALEVRILRQPHYPNYRLADYFSERDCYSGVTVGHLDVAAARPKD